MSIRSILISCFIPFIFAFQLPGQTVFPYQFKSGTESSLLGAGILTTSASYYLGRKVKPITLEQISRLNINQVPSFDRYSTRYYSTRAHQISNISGLASLAFPFVVLWGKQSQKNRGKLMLIGLEGAIINVGLTNLTKTLSKRIRPYVYNEQVPIDVKTAFNSRYSFFSGHTSLSAYFTFVGAQMYSDLYPNSNKKPLVWTAAAVIPLITGFSRMRAGKHFPTDVIVGYAVGAFLGILVPRIHRF